MRTSLIKYMKEIEVSLVVNKCDYGICQLKITEKDLIFNTDDEKFVIPFNKIIEKDYGSLV